MAFIKFSLFALFTCFNSLQFASADVPLSTLYSPYSRNPAARVQAAALSTNNIGAAEAIKDQYYNDLHLDFQDILRYPPHRLHCDCDFSTTMDPNIAIQLQSIAVTRNQRECDIQQLYLIIDSLLRTLDYNRRTAMVDYFALAMQNEQNRRQLTFKPEYPISCNYLYQNVANPLVKRSVISPVTPVSTYPVLQRNFLPYYDNLQNYWRRFMPDVSYQLDDDVENAIYYNTDIRHLGYSSELKRQILSNMQWAMSQMYTYQPSRIPNVMY